MFSGAFVHRIDEKGRLMIPPKFRALLGETFTIARGMGGCLWLFREQEWSELQKKLEPQSLVNRNALLLQRYFLAGVSDASLDPQGRLAIPAVLRTHAKLDHEVMVMGATSRIEIWSKAAWDEYESRITEDQLEEIGTEVMKLVQPASSGER